MNEKSYFAFLEFSILNSVKQILKKQLFTKEELRKKWRKSQILVNTILATVNRIFQNCLLSWVITLNTFCLPGYFIFIHFWKLTFGPDGNKLLFLNTRVVLRCVWIFPYRSISFTLCKRWRPLDLSGKGRMELEICKISVRNPDCILTLNA